MKRIFIYCLLLCCSIPDGFAQLQSISFEEIDSLQRIEKRKTIVFIQTIGAILSCDENTTFKTEGIIEELNNALFY
jgi:hypothetical protein